MTGNSTENVWYIARDGQQHGPISETEMRLFVENSHLRATDLLWRPGFAEWRPAASVFPNQVAAAPGPAPQAQPETAESGAADNGTRGNAPARSPSGAAAATEDKPADSGRTAHTPHSAAPVAVATAPRPAQTAQSAAPARAKAQPSGPSAGPGAGQSTLSRQAPRDGGPREGALAAQSVASRAAAASSAPSGPGGSPKAAPYEPKSIALGAQVAPAGTGRGRKLALAAVLVVMIASSLTYVVSHKDDIMALVGVKAGEPGSEVPVVKAQSSAPPETVQQETAALQRPEPATELRPAEPAQSAPVTNAPGEGTAATQSTVTPTAAPPIDEAASATAADTYYQRSKLWQYMKRAYPDWYGERISAAAALGSGGVPARDATKSMVEGLVALRRQHAESALSADMGMLKAIAAAFLRNLQSLADRGPDTCYGFISQGETSPKSVDLFHAPQSAPELEGQALTIFEAIASGKAAPTQHERPKKGDYDVLAAELGKLGWSQADLQLFADPKALSSAPPARVCAMVRDWFKAHIAISDAAVQERLLVETLRPVVAG